jgi:hypothetical protein
MDQNLDFPVLKILPVLSVVFQVDLPMQPVLLRILQ